MEKKITRRNGKKITRRNVEIETKLEQTRKHIEELEKAMTTWE